MSEKVADDENPSSSPLQCAVCSSTTDVSLVCRRDKRPFCTTCVFGEGAAVANLCPWHVLERPDFVPTMIRAAQTLEETEEKDTSTHSLDEDPDDEEEQFIMPANLADSSNSIRSETGLAWEKADVTPLKSRLDVAMKDICSAVSDEDPQRIISIMGLCMDQDVTSKIDEYEYFNTFVMDLAKSLETQEAAALSRWLSSRCERPVDGVPSWVVSLYECADEHRLLASHLMAILVLSNQTGKLKESSYGKKRKLEAKPTSLVCQKLDGMPMTVYIRLADLTLSVFPKHNDCSMLPPKLNDYDSIIRIFVSHAWLEEDHPDPAGVDISLVRDFFAGAWSATTALVDALQSLSIPDHTILDGAFQFRTLGGNQTQVMGYQLENGFVSGPLARALLDLAIEHREDAPDRILLWIDYVSLPQWPRRADDEQWFRESLERLNVIQDSMYTLVVVSKHSRYDSRAWCVAEMLNANGFSYTLNSSSTKNKDPNRVFGLGREHILCDCMRYFVGSGCHTADKIIESLQLGITNKKADSNTVCRVLWSRLVEEIRGNEVWWDSMGSKNEGLPWLVWSGLSKHAVQYLDEFAQTETIDYDSWWLKWQRLFDTERIPIASTTIWFLASGDPTGATIGVGLRGFCLAASFAIASLVPEEVLVNLHFVHSVQEIDKPGLIVGTACSEDAELAEFIVCCSGKQRMC